MAHANNGQSGITMVWSQSHEIIYLYKFFYFQTNYFNPLVLPISV